MLVVITRKGDRMVTTMGVGVGKGIGTPGEVFDKKESCFQLIVPPDIGGTLSFVYRHHPKMYAPRPKLSSSVVVRISQVTPPL